MAQTLGRELERDAAVCVVAGDDLPNDLGRHILSGLARRFGRDRVRVLPGDAVVEGAAEAAAGGRCPVVLLPAGRFRDPALSRLLAEDAGAWTGVAPTVLLVLGTGADEDDRPSRCLETWLLNLGGSVVAMPATAADAATLLRGAVRDPRPAVVVSPPAFADRADPAPEAEAAVPLGRAMVRRPGRDITVVAASRLVGTALDAAERLGREAIGVEVVDLRCLAPLDLETILGSVRRTHALVLPQEAVGLAGAGAEIAAQVGAAALDFLDTPIVRPAVPLGPDRLPDPEALAVAIRAIS